MLDQPILDRSAKLLETFEAERSTPFALDLRTIDARAAASGSYQSSARLLAIQQAYQNELRARSMYAWQSLVRVHRIHGCPNSETLREDLRNTLFGRMDDCFSRLDAEFRACVSKTAIKLDLSLREEFDLLLKKHDVEIDLYVDAMNTPTDSKNAGTSQYNFYAAVGSVQTGANSVANVVQQLAGSDKEALASALTALRDALDAADGLNDNTKDELRQIADDCVGEIAAEKPNSMKLSSLLTTLGTTVQTLASVQPAYAALKTAALAVGVVLP